MTFRINAFSGSLGPFGAYCTETGIPTLSTLLFSGSGDLLFAVEVFKRRVHLKYVHHGRQANVSGMCWCCCVWAVFSCQHV